MAMVADPLVWLQQHTLTHDKHWLDIPCRVCGAPHKKPNKPFPDKAYFGAILPYLQQKSILFIEKSRDMMMSWLCVGFLTHAAMTTEGIEVLFQSQKEDKAAELVEYSKCLYRNSKPEIRKAYPLAAQKESWLEMKFAHGSRIIGIPSGADQIRSYHPWALLQDEAAHTPNAGESFAAAIAACQKIIVLSSAGPGWFGSCCESAK